MTIVSNGAEYSAELIPSDNEGAIDICADRQTKTFRIVASDINAEPLKSVTLNLAEVLQLRDFLNSQELENIIA